MLVHLSFVIPARRLRETGALLAFPHPKPAHRFHVLLVPKKAIRSLAELKPDDPFLSDLVTSTQSIVAEHHLAAYRLIVNGGKYQDFPLLHFHLVSDE
jgi:histidine triad (HIT) family protein